MSCPSAWEKQHSARKSIVLSSRMASARRPSKACLCSALCLWLFASVLLLIASGIVYLGPFVKVARFQKTRCIVESYFFTTQYVCSCGSECQSSYPCFVLHVSLPNVTLHQEHLWVVTLYSDDQHQAKVIGSEQDTRERVRYDHTCL